MTAMAATTGRLITPILALVLIASACSGNDDDIGTLPEVSTTPTTADTTTSSSTMTTEPTTTTLSELETAEAEIRAIVIEWHQFPFDTSIEENDDLQFQSLTGLLLQRATESYARYRSEGVVLRAAGPAPIAINDITIDLEAGTAEVDACTGSTGELLDGDTLEVLQADDPTDTNTSIFQFQLVDGEWKIYEWLPSRLTSSGPVPCEVSG